LKPGIRRILVTGAGGQLGRALLAIKWPTSTEVVGFGRSQLDITDPDAVDEALAAPFDLAVNAAAHTAVDAAESKVEEAFAVNRDGPLNLARACARSDIALIHVSTDYVFDGMKASAYCEEDAINPLSVYGESKAAGEMAIRDASDKHIILRTAWLFSAGPQNFVGKIQRGSREKAELSIVADQVGNPSSAHDVAEAIAKLSDQVISADCGRPPSWGTYHCVNAGYASWYDFAQEIVKQSPVNGAQPVSRLRAITTGEYPCCAKRPANSRLNSNKLESTFGIRLRPWRAALAAVIAEAAAKEMQ